MEKPSTLTLRSVPMSLMVQEVFSHCPSLEDFSFAPIKKFRLPSNEFYMHSEIFLETFGNKKVSFNMLRPIPS